MIKMKKERIKRKRSKTRRQFDDDEEEEEEEDEEDYLHNNDDEGDVEEEGEDEEEEEDVEDVIEVMKHTSKYTYKITCDCGNIQIDQADPFDVKVGRFEGRESIYGVLLVMFKVGEWWGTVDDVFLMMCICSRFSAVWRHKTVENQKPPPSLPQHKRMEPQTYYHIADGKPHNLSKHEGSLLQKRWHGVCL